MPKVTRFNGGSPKQNLFVKKYLENGQNGTQAALAAYDTKDPVTASVIASENLDKPNVREMVENALRKNDLTPDKITGNLKKIAIQEPEKVSANVVLRTNVELLKLWGAYPGSKHTSLNVSFKGKIKEMKFQDLKKYVEGLRSQNDELLEEADTQTHA